MKREEFISICDKKIKLVRAEYSFSQDKMAKIIGLSKKTLVEIEKGRSTLGFMGSVCLCSIFSDSEVIESTFGGNPEEIIKALSFENLSESYPKTMGGKVWWTDVLSKNGYKIQQNYISKHYRLLDKDDKRLISSFDYDEIVNEYKIIIGNKE